MYNKQLKINLEVLLSKIDRNKLAKESCEKSSPQHDLVIVKPPRIEQVDVDDLQERGGDGRSFLLFL